MKLKVLNMDISGLKDLFNKFISLSDGLRESYSASLSNAAYDWEKTLNNGLEY